MPHLQRFILLLVCVTLPMIATAQNTQIVTTSGGVQRLAVPVEQGAPASMALHQSTPRHTMPSSALHPQARQPTANRPTVSRQPQPSHAVARVTRIPSNVTNSAINTATRTTEQQLNRQINSAIRRSIRNTIQF